MADRTWKEIRDALIAAVRIASRLPAAAHAINWKEDNDTGKFKGELDATLEILSTGSEGQRLVNQTVPCLADNTVVPPVTAGQFFDQEIGVSRVTTFVLSIRCRSQKNARDRDALHMAETIRAWMYPGASPSASQILNDAGVVYVDDLALTPVPDYDEDDRRRKVWVLDLEFRAEVYLASTERVGTIERVQIAGVLDPGAIPVVTEVPEP